MCLDIYGDNIALKFSKKYFTIKAHGTYMVNNVYKIYQINLSLIARGTEREFKKSMKDSTGNILIWIRKMSLRKLKQVVL